MLDCLKHQIQKRLHFIFILVLLIFLELVNHSFLRNLTNYKDFNYRYSKNYLVIIINYFKCFSYLQQINLKNYLNFNLFLIKHFIIANYFIKDQFIKKKDHYFLIIKVQIVYHFLP